MSSGFLGHTTAKDLKRAFEECTEKLDLKNLIQVSMDGPNINWKMLDLIVEDRNSNEAYPNLLDVQTFQSDGPLLPFITSELETLLQTLMGKFMKRAVLEGANIAYKIAKLNVLDSATHVTPSEVDIGFAAKTTLEKVYKEKKISQLQVLEFRKECESMLATTVAKIQERSPLKYNFARKLASLDPRVMVSNPDQAIKIFEEVLQRLIETR